jgi:hypothetical protein
MPSTYTLIKGETLASSAASYTFTAIPSTFTDLMVRVSLRADGGATGFLMNFNGDSFSSGTLYSDTYIYGNGSTLGSGRDTSGPVTYVLAGATGSGDTANTFSNAEIYIPSYTASQNKSFGSNAARETNAASSSEINVATAHLYRSTTAISSISLKPPGTMNFISGSSFYLYGISKS